MRPAPINDAQPHGLAAADGRVWFAEDNAGAVGTVTPTGIV